MLWADHQHVLMHNIFFLPKISGRLSIVTPVLGFIIALITKQIMNLKIICQKILHIMTNLQLMLVIEHPTTLWLYVWHERVQIGWEGYSWCHLQRSWWMQRHLPGVLLWWDSNLESQPGVHAPHASGNMHQNSSTCLFERGGHAYDLGKKVTRLLFERLEKKNA